MATGTDKSVTDSDVELVTWAQNKLTQFTTATNQWRNDAIDAYAAVAGDQWDAQVKQELEDDSRPVFTFNRIAGFIRGICGLETSTRNQVQFFGREIDDSGQADVVNGAVKYVRESCDADDEESDSFKDMLICGLGWTETYFTTEESTEGDIIVERCDPLHCAYDPSARKRGLADTRWRARYKWLPKSTIKDVWGASVADKISTEIDNDAERDETGGSIHVSGTRDPYADGDNDGDVKVTNGIKVVQFQYVKTCYYMEVMNPESGESEEITVEEFDKINKRLKKAKLPLLEGERVKHRQYRQMIFSGGVLLEDEVLPCAGFTLQAITGVRDRNCGVWYGFVRDLLDPQRWINKFFSSMADVVASQAKGGLLAEADAFVSKEDAADDWADPRSIVWLKRGGLERIKERSNQGVPAGLNQLLDFTVQSLPDVAGVNLEFLGMAGREQPGVLEHQRKQAAISTMAEFFNALRLYRKQQGRVLVQFIHAFINDGRLIRIVGKKEAKYVPLSFNLDTLKYDIVVDEAPNSPNQKEQTWQALMQVLPVAASMGMPIPPDVIQYAPFPQALKEDWLAYADQSGGNPQEMKAQMQQMQQQVQALQQENQQLKGKKEEAMAKIQLDGQSDQAKLQQDQQRIQAELQLKRETAQAELELKRETFMAEMQLEQMKLGLSNDLERERIQVNAAAQVESAAINGAQQAANKPEAKPEPASKEDGALKAVAKALEALAGPKTISDGKGKTYTVKPGKA